MASSESDILIIGAGPAGLSAALELFKHGATATLLEADPTQVGGLSRTVLYRGHRFDIGGHRFFSKNAEINELWDELLGADMLSVPRLSRIVYGGKMFNYPLQASNAFWNLGPLETLRCVASFLLAQLRPRDPVVSFEDMVVNRFGHRLYSIFFKTYTEKVWGIPGHEISADFASARISGLNLWKAAKQALGLVQKGDKSLIERFRYPRLGPGQMWDRVAEIVTAGGCRVEFDAPVSRLEWDASGVTAVQVRDRRLPCRHLISSMPLRHLILGLDPPAPPEVRAAAEGLLYRDFLTVALILEGQHLFPDHWIYVHDPGVMVGRVQNYGNWSPAMVGGPGLTNLGLEYFCSEGDALWERSDEALIELGAREMEQLGLIRRSEVVDGAVVRMHKAYPVYDERYREHVGVIRRFLDGRLPNLQVAGRNGMHFYNSQDHAMLTGMMAARNALGHAHFDLWKVTIDAEYAGDGSVGGRLVPRRLTV